LGRPYSQTLVLDGKVCQARTLVNCKHQQITFVKSFTTFNLRKCCFGLTS